MDDFGIYAFAFSMGIFSSVISEAGTNSIVIQRMVKNERSPRIISYYSGSITAIKFFLYIITSTSVILYVYLATNLDKSKSFFYLYQIYGLLFCLQPLFVFIVINKLIINSFIIAVSKIPILIYIIFFFNPKIDSYLIIPIVDIASITAVIFLQYIYLGYVKRIKFLYKKRLVFRLIGVLKFFYLSNFVSSSYHRMHYFFVAQLGTPYELGIIGIVDRFLSIWGQIYNPALTLIIPKLARSRLSSHMFIKILKTIFKYLLILISMILFLSIYLFLANNSKIDILNIFYILDSRHLIYLASIALGLMMFLASILGYPVASISGKYHVSQYSIYIGFTTAILLAYAYIIFGLSINILIYSILILLCGELSILLVRLVYLYRIKI